MTRHLQRNAAVPTSHWGRQSTFICALGITFSAECAAARSTVSGNSFSRSSFTSPRVTAAPARIAVSPSGMPVPFPPPLVTSLEPPPPAPSYHGDRHPPLGRVAHSFQPVSLPSSSTRRDRLARNVTEKVCCYHRPSGAYHRAGRPSIMREQHDQMRNCRVIRAAPISNNPKSGAVPLPGGEPQRHGEAARKMPGRSSIERCTFIGMTPQAPVRSRSFR